LLLVANWGTKLTSLRPEEIGEYQGPGSQYSESVESFGNTTQTSKSVFSKTSIFDKSDAKGRNLVEKDPREYITPGTRIRRQGSFSSVRSSLATDIDKSGQRRVPPRPNETSGDAIFVCFVCQENVRDIHNRESWK
jgi:hypothetical protein